MLIDGVGLHDFMVGFLTMITAFLDAIPLALQILLFVLGGGLIISLAVIFTVTLISCRTNVSTTSGWLTNFARMFSHNVLDGFSILGVGIPLFLGIFTILLPIVLVWSY